MRNTCNSIILFVLMLTCSNCTYFKQRLDDGLDCFYFTAGPTIGIGCDLSASGLTSSAGYYRSNVYGWGGRKSIHRLESGGGLAIFSSLYQRDTESSWRKWPPIHPIHRNIEDTEVPIIKSLEKEVSGETPLPYVFDAHAGAFSIAPLDPVFGLYTIDPERRFHEPIVRREVSCPEWGFGGGAAAGVIALRVGVKPTAVLNFTTGWLGFHLFPPYKAFSNTLAPRYLRDRGILVEKMEQDPISYILLDLNSSNASVRAHSIKTLGAMGDKALPYIPYLLRHKMMHSRHIDDKIHVIMALEQIDPNHYPSNTALEILLEEVTVEREHKLINAVIRRNTVEVRNKKNK